MGSHKFQFQSDDSRCLVIRRRCNNQSRVQLPLCASIQLLFLEVWTRTLRNILHKPWTA